jgi:hypothetical protein
MSEQRLKTSHTGNEELEKVMQALPKDMQSLFSALASAA